MEWRSEQPVDFEAIGRELENLETKPNEPAESLLFRASEIVRESMPIWNTTLDKFSPLSRTAGNLLFAYPAIRNSVDVLLKRIRVEGYFPEGKFNQSYAGEMEDWIIPAGDVSPAKQLDFSSSEVAKKTFSKTVKNRQFFNPGGFNANERGIIEHTFLISNPQTETEWLYLEERVNNKDILLVGGHHSCGDLLGGRLKPRSVTNIDPFMESEPKSVDFPDQYKFHPFAAEEADLKEKLGMAYDEIWLTYSVPMYSMNPEAIIASMDNVVSLLAVKGTVRIYPLGVQQNQDLPPEQRLFSDSMSDALIEKIESLQERDDLNVFYLPINPSAGGALFIQKIK